MILSLLLCGCGSGVRSLRLTDHVPSRVRAACAQAARDTRVRVVCPPLVPGSGVTSERDLYGPQVLARDVYTLSFNNGEVPGHIHCEVGAGAMLLAILRSARGDHVTGVRAAVAGCRAVVAK